MDLEVHVAIQKSFNLGLPFPVLLKYQSSKALLWKLCILIGLFGTLIAIILGKVQDD
jgi:hypothetical protein